MKTNYLKHRSARGAFERPGGKTARPPSVKAAPGFVADAGPMDFVLADGRRPRVTLLMDTASRAVVGWQMS
ncbi:hypothetical protein QH494_03800 [Sphingomonas sp. AR_OL41]|uniref:hypothetical protein n=1 Tax=Sphingomonas sp. AR_OL41 TaxID=3042729 RepID=UPI0024810469|nr:hypothetical protein [Sphingomonas sp. AR_OL41]MDH7971294.1 hypothetical protein [Sphingomonas sp. AR_OL41]